MVVYVEVAFLENFLIDAALLWLTLFAGKRKITVWKIGISAAIGALFAVIFPLYSYPKRLEYALKFSVGFLLPYVAASEKGIGRYAMNVGLFLSFSFGFGGAVIALTDFFGANQPTVSIGVIVAVGVLFMLTTVGLIQRLHQRRELQQFVYACRIRKGAKEVRAEGFLDSGNRLRVNGKPVCFITPDLVYELIGATYIAEETTVKTVVGCRKIKIFQADRLEIYCGKTPHTIEKIYLSPSTQILGREYKILLGAWAMAGKEATK